MSQVDDAGAADDRSGVNRRRFFTLSAATASIAMLAARGGHASAATQLPGTALAPANRGLSAADVAALAKRGVPSSYTGTELRYIGMPVGGGACGQVYLGGDGKLWYWDVDNAPAPAWANCGGPNYAQPLTPFSPFGNGFVLRTSALGKSSARSVDSTGFGEVTFTGQYPLGQVDFRDSDCPVAVHLEAFAPFIPGNAADSTLPGTVLAYTLTNTSPMPVEAELTGWAENPIALRARTSEPITLSSQAVGGSGYQGVQFTAANESVTGSQPDIVFETWEQSDYSGWTATGTAFGSGPVLVSEVPSYMLRFGSLNAQGPRFTTSFNFIAANGDAGLADSYTGTLTSADFTVSRRFVAAWVGGGYNPGQTCLNVVVDGTVVGSVTGNDTEPMLLQSIDLIKYQGKTAHIEIVDSATGGWGHVSVSNITFTDAPAVTTPINTMTDGGTMTIGAVVCNGLPGAQTAQLSDIRVRPSIADWSSPSAIATSGPGPASIDGGLGTIAGAVTTRFTLLPGQARTVRFVLTWYFPNPDRLALSFITDINTLQRHYANQFSSSAQVLGYLAGNLARLETTTRTWVKTWYDDSTLPHWFLERTLLTSGSLATNVALRFTNGRFWAWEGVDCAAGTCEHVWSYAHGIGRLFPELERDTRQRVDLGIGFHADTGEMGNRAEADMGWATDGQCGTILRIYREHQMSQDNTFLQANWANIKKAMTWVINHDTKQNGTLAGAQPNTLDATWYGENAWMTGMYDAALLACAQLAGEMGDTAFAQACTALATAGMHSIATELWTGEYFIQLIDPKAPDAPNSNIGCHIDQMLGQNAAWQLGLPRVFDPAQTATALASIYKYNFVPDPAAYRAANPAIPGGRWFAMAGEPAMIMTTFPHGGGAQANGNPPAGVAMYFNESWTGQEYQLAAHMIYEGMVEEGLTITNAVHNRYAPAKRNPYNEIECSDHYTRAMAGYGVFLAASGFSCHGPQGRLGFGPRLTPENFAAAFTCAGGWGLYRQQRSPQQQTCSIEVRYGQARLAVLELQLPSAIAAPTVQVNLSGQPVSVSQVSSSGDTVTITLATPVTVPTGGLLTATIALS